MAGMLVLGDREHQARLVGIEAYSELKRIEGEVRLAEEENAASTSRVAQLEQELARSQTSEDIALTRVRKFEATAANLENVRASLQAEAVEMFRGSAKYATELGTKAAEKIHETYVVAEKYLKEQSDGDFDGFIEVFLIAEEEKARASRDTAEADDHAQWFVVLD